VKILVLGDSHADVWRHIDSDIKFDVLPVGGATSTGVNKPNSKSNSLIAFRQKIKETKESDYVMIMLGEVDCGFAIWYYAEKYKIPIDKQLAQSLTAYEKFLNEEILKKFHNTQVIIVGSVLPTIKDQTNKMFLKGARSQINASLIDRTKLTIDYNSELKIIARRLGTHYIDITNELLGSNGVIKDEYLNKDPYNHHLDTDIASKVWFQKLQTSVIKTSSS